MTLPGLGAGRDGPGRDAEASARVRGWVRDALEPDDERSIVVTELTCTEPGCPPIETVIGLLGDGRQDQHKIHKPVADVTADDVAAVLGGTTHDHP